MLKRQTNCKYGIKIKATINIDEWQLKDKWQINSIYKP